MTSTPSATFDPLSIRVTLVRAFSRGKASSPSSCHNATGFFFKKDSQEYLITNRHVVIDENKQTFPDILRIKVHIDEESLPRTRDIKIPLYDERNPIWKEHPDNNNIKNIKDKIDLVALRINDYLQKKDFVDFFTIDDLPQEYHMFNLGESCIVIGYPYSFHDLVNYLPVARIGAIASTWGENFNGNKYFLVDSRLHPGTSGSPVIIPESKMREDAQGFEVGTFPPLLIGVNSGAWPELDLNITWYSTLIPEII